MPDRVRRLLVLLLVLCFTTSWLPSAGPPIRTVLDAYAGQSSRVPPLTPAAPAIPRPAAAISSGLPANSIAPLRDTYAHYHTLTGVLDGQFNGVQRLTATIPSARSSGAGHSEVRMTLPAGRYDRAVVSVAMTAGFYGGAATLDVRPAGTTAWISARVLAHPGAAYGAPPATAWAVDVPVTLGAIADPTTPLDVRLRCDGTLGHEATCTWSHLRFFEDAPGWRYTRADEPRTDLTFGVQAGSFQGLSEQAGHGSFLALESFHRGGGAAWSARLTLSSAVMQLPPFHSTDPVTVSVDWARTLPDPQPGDLQALGVDLLFAPLDGDDPVTLLQIPDGGAAAWQRQPGTHALPEHLAGQRGRVLISARTGFTPRVIGLDALTFYQGGRPIAVPADQVVGKCVCDIGGAIQSIVGDPVNTASGAYYLAATDLTLPSGGPPLTFARTYVSRFADTSLYPVSTLGPGWRHSFAAALTLPDHPQGAVGTLIYEAPTGNRLRFYTDAAATLTDPFALEDADGVFDPAPGIRATLRRDADGSYTLRSREGRIERFDAEGRLIEQRDAQGHAQQLTYYAASSPWAGQLQQIQDLTTQRSMTLNYVDQAGLRVARVTDSAGRSVTYRYTGAGELWQVVDLRGGTTTYGYDGTSHLLTTIDDPAQVRQISTTYDAQRRVAHQVDALGATTTFSYGTAADGTQRTTVTREAGGATDVLVDQYRADGSLEYQQHGDMLVGYMAYGTHFAPTVQVDGNGHAMVQTADTLGRPTTVITAAQQQTTLRYGGTPTTITDTQGTPLGTAFQDPPRLAELVDAAGSTTLRYDDAGNVVRITTTGTDGHATLATSATYSAGGRLAEQRRADGVITRYAYDALAQLQQITVGAETPLAQVTTYGYDPLGRRTTVTEGVGGATPRRTETRYTADGSVAEHIQNYEDGTFDPHAPDTDVRTRFGYDLLGRRIWAEDALGHADVTHYNAAGQIDWTIRTIDQRLLDPVSPTQQLQFRSFDPATPDRNIATLYSYDALGRLSLTTETGLLAGSFDPATRRFPAATTRVTRTAYDAQNRPVAVTYNHQPGVTEARPDTNLETLTVYDGVGNPTWTRDTLGRWTRTDYDALNQPVLVTENYENGDPTTIDTQNQSWASAADTDIQTRTAYTALGQIERTITNAIDGMFSHAALTEDLITRSIYDALGRPIQTIASYDETNTGGAAGTNRVTRSVYEATTGRRLGQQDALGHWTRYTYDALGRVTTTITNCRAATITADLPSCETFDPLQPDRNVAHTQHYDARGRAHETVDVTGRRTRREFDGLDRVVATIRNAVDGSVDGAATDVEVTTRTGYDAVGRVTQQIDAAGSTTSFGIDGLGRTVSVTDPLGRVTEHGYDGSGTLRWTAQPGQRLTVIEVDALGRATATIQNYQDGAVTAQEPSDQDLITRTRYDAAGRRVQTIDAAGHVTAFQYDLLDRLIAVQENVVSGGCATTDCNVLTRYAYDRLGNRTAIIDARGHRRNFTFDAAGQPQTATDANGQQTAWTFDAGGHLLSEDAPGGTADDRHYTYDGLGRPITVQAANLAAPITTSYTPEGWRAQLTDATGATTFSYDALGRLTAVQAPATGTVGYRSDAAGRRTQLIYPDGLTLDYRYWPDGQLRDVQQAGAALASYTYDGTTGRLAQVTRANGTLTTYRFDQADRLRELHTTVGGALRAQFSYTVDRRGQRTEVNETLALPAPSPTNTPTRTPTSTLTATPTSTPTSTPTNTPTSTPTRTPTSTPTSMPVPPTATPNLLSVPTTTIDAAYANSAGGLTIIKGDRYWYQVVPGGNWTTATLAAAWHTTASPAGYSVPTTAIDTAYFAPGLSSTGAFTVIKGDRYWYRATPTAAWISGTLAAAWTTTASPAGYPVPTTAVDAAYFNSSGGFTVIKGDRYWYRATATSAWISGTLAAAWNTTASPAGYPVPTSAVDAAYYSAGGSFTVMKLDRSWSKLTTASPWTSQTLAQQVGPTPQMVQAGAPPSSERADLPADSIDGLVLHSRSIHYTYDGLRRLTGAVETPGRSSHYTYDVAGNRLATQVNGVSAPPVAYDAANQVVGWTYDARGNLLSDGTTSYAYDALGRLTSEHRAGVTTTNTYNGDGVLVAQQQGPTTTRYAQDLALPLAQVVQRTQGSDTTDYLYGLDRLVGVSGGAHTWYGSDALGSVRHTLDPTGQPLASFSYDPWGMPDGGATPSTFGFTGELQDGATGAVYLRARWYRPGQGTLLGRDPFPGDPQQPVSMHPYQYAYADPVRLRDPSGKNPALCLLPAFADAMLPVGDIAAVGCFAAYAGSAMAGVAAGQAVGGALAEFTTDPSLGGPYSTGGVAVPPPGRPHTGSPYPLLPPWQLPPTTYSTDGEWLCVVPPTTLPPFLQPPVVRPGPTLLPGEGPLVLQQSDGQPPFYIDREFNRYATPRPGVVKLGLRDTLTNSVPGVIHDNWALEGLIPMNGQFASFWDRFHVAVWNASAINFNLDSIGPDSPEFWARYRYSPHGYTYVELDQVLHNPDLLVKTTFYRNAQPLSQRETERFIDWWIQLRR